MHSAVGGVGEIHVRGANVMDRYWNAPEATKEVLLDGWLATGDLGYRDTKGYFRIVDRKKDVIISGGFNVYTAEVESVLNKHPTVIEAAVIGIPHDEWGEAVHAIVVTASKNPSTLDDLLAHCRDELAKYKVPKSVSIAGVSFSTDMGAPPYATVRRLLRSRVRNRGDMLSR